MRTVSAALGAATATVWKRRSRPGSFSIVFLNLSGDEAPRQRSAPRASAGLRMAAPSTSPPVAAAPPGGHRLWMSSMNRTITPPAPPPPPTPPPNPPPNAPEAPPEPDEPETS